MPSGTCAVEEVGLSCSYSAPDGCGPTCDCVVQGSESVWACSYPPCAADVCPNLPPPSGSSCDESGQYCYYPEDGGCYGDTAVCEASGTWTVSVGGFCDAGFSEGD
jgi:hypothetical protein